MKEEKKKCPYCGEDIEIQSTICEFCGEKLEQDVEQKQKESILDRLKCLCSKNIIWIKGLAIILVVSLILVCLYLNEINSANKLFKQVETKNPTDILKAVAEDEKAMEKYLSQVHLKSSKDKALLYFLEETRKKSIKFDESLALYEYIDENYDAVYNTLNSKKPLKYKNVVFKMGENDRIYIDSPKTKIFRIVYDGEGGFYPLPSYKYINEKFSSKLAPAGKKYISELAKEDEMTGNVGYLSDGAITITKQQIADRLLSWLEFRKKYPEFTENSDYLKKRIDFLTRDLIVDTYQTWDSYEYGVQPSLSSQAKKAYEYFLDKADKETKEYKVVKDCYEILKSHNYRSSDAFYEKVNEEYGELPSYT